MVELYKYNLETYNRVKDVLTRSSYVLLIQTVGTGKSYVTMRLMQDDYKGKHILYVVPKTAIQDNLMLYPEWVTDNTDFVTYAKLTMLDVRDVISAYDVFVFDEVHHAGASIWGRPVREIIASGKICIGLTATPVRGDGVDVRKEIFNDVYVYGPCVGEAIENHIWKEFKYVVTINKVYERLLHAKQKVDALPVTVETLDIKAESMGYTLDDISNYTVRNIIEAYSDKVASTKWLVFCSSVHQLDIIDDDVCDWFNYQEVEILKVDSRMSHKSVKDILTKFNGYTGDKILVLASVNMLLEGLHLVGVNGMVILRHTQSVSVFIQLMGRAMSASGTTVPLIVDVAENLTMLRRIVCETLRKEDTIIDKDDVGKCKPKSNVMLSRELSIQMEMLVSAEEFIEKVNSLNMDSIWTDEELHIMRVYYPDVENRLHKSKLAIRKKAVEMGLLKRVVWSVKEDEILKSYYPTLGIAVSKMLDNKTKAEIRTRVRYFKLKYSNRWSFEEDESVLRGIIPEGRSKTECIRRANKLRRELT